MWTTEAGHLEAVGGRARCTARQVHLAATRPVDGCRWLVAEPWFTASEPQHVWLDDMHAVFLRPEPPFDEACRTATLILDLVDQGRTPVLNSPSGPGTATTLAAESKVRLAAALGTYAFSASPSPPVP